VQRSVPPNEPARWNAGNCTAMYLMACFSMCDWCLTLHAAVIAKSAPSDGKEGAEGSEAGAPQVEYYFARTGHRVHVPEYLTPGRRPAKKEIRVSAPASDSTAVVSTTEVQSLQQGYCSEPLHCIQRLMLACSMPAAPNQLAQLHGCLRCPRHHPLPACSWTAPWSALSVCWGGMAR
jgi:hypothetical protein